MLIFDIAHEERFVQVAVEAVMVDRHVEITNVSILERSTVGNAVANHLVDRRTAGFREFVVVQWTRVTITFDCGWKLSSR